jgi:hypothetical protein
MIQTPGKLVAEKGILPKPVVKLGKLLPLATAEIMKHFMYLKSTGSCSDRRFLLTQKAGRFIFIND